MMKKRVSIGVVLVLIMLLASIYTAESVNKRKNEQINRQEPFAINQQVEVDLYFANTQAQLVSEQRMIPKTEDLPQASIRALIAGPKGSELIATLPKDTILKSITIKDGVAYVDFDSKLAKEVGAGSANEMLAVYAVVNTLSAQQGISEVMILLDGGKVETLSGHLDLSQPMKKTAKIKGGADDLEK